MTHHRQWMDPGYIRGKEYYRDKKGHRQMQDLAMSYRTRAASLRPQPRAASSRGGIAIAGRR